MTFPRTKLMLFHRQNLKNPKAGSRSLILLTPDGYLSKIHWSYFISKLYEDPPCYGGGKTFIEFEGDSSRRKFPSARAAFNAMRKYEKENELPKAEFIGTI